MSRSNAPNSTDNAIPQLPTFPFPIASQATPTQMQQQQRQAQQPIPTAASLQYQQSNTTTSTASSVGSISLTDVKTKLNQFIKSLKHERSTKPDTFDPHKWNTVFSRLFDHLKAALDGPSMNEQGLKECERVISPLICDLICELPPHLGPKHMMNGDAKMTTEKSQDIKSEICDWLKHSKYLHVMDMQYIERILRHCVYHENEAVAISWYEVMTSSKLSPIRQKYKQWKSKYQNARRQTNVDPRNLLAHLPGKLAFDFITLPRDDRSLLPFLKPMTLLIQIVKEVTKRLQNPLEWIQKLYSNSKTDEFPTTHCHYQALEGHSFMLAPLQHLKYASWIVDLAGDVGEYYTSYIASSKDPKLLEIRNRANSPEFTSFINECSDMKVVFNLLEAVINVYRITDDQLTANGITLRKGSEDPITKIRSNWLALLSSGMHYMYMGWAQSSHAGVYQRDRAHWTQLKEWEKVHIPGLIEVTFNHHIVSMRKTRSNEDYCQFLKVIATKCAVLPSFCSLLAKSHYTAFVNRTLFLGESTSTSGKSGNVFGQSHSPRISSGALCLHDNILMKFNVEFWFYCMLCSFWMNICPTTNNRGWQYKDFQYYCGSDMKQNCAIFEFDLIRKSLTILLSVVRNEKCSMHLQEYAVQAITAVIRFVGLFESQYVAKSAAMLMEIYTTFDTVKWTLESKLDDIDGDLDHLFKLLHVKQYTKNLRRKRERERKREIERESQSNLIKTQGEKSRKRKHSECTGSGRANDPTKEDGPNKRRKMMMMMDVDEEKEERANGSNGRDGRDTDRDNNADQTASGSVSVSRSMKMEMDDDNNGENGNNNNNDDDHENEQEQDHDMEDMTRTANSSTAPPMESWIDSDYTTTRSKEVTASNGVVEVETDPIGVGGDEHRNADWIMYETEYLISLLFRCIRYARNFEHDFLVKCKQYKVTIPEAHLNVFTDRDIHRCSKAFATHLRILRIYTVPQHLLPHLHFKTREEILDQGVHQFLRQLTPQQARSVWSTNMELLIRLAEAFPHCTLFGMALRNHCKNASTLMSHAQSQSQSRRPSANVEHQNHAVKSFIACDAYLGYLLANLESLLGDDRDEKILLSHFDGDTKVNQHDAMQFIERHFFQSVPPKDYYKTFKDNSKGYGFTLHYDSNAQKWHRIPTFHGFILPPLVEEETFTMFTFKYMQYKRCAVPSSGSSREDTEMKEESKEALSSSTSSSKPATTTKNVEIVRKVVSYLDLLDDTEIKSMIKKYRRKHHEYASTRWVQLERHHWIIDTTEHVIRCLFKLFMQIHHVQYPPQNRGQNPVNHGWKQLPKLYGDAQAMITHYAKELIFKCITLSFKTSHCLPYIRLLQQIMTKCIENQFVGLLVPYTYFIVPPLVSLAYNRSLRFNTNLSHFEHESDHSPYKVLSCIPREFEAILCKASECSLIVTSDTTPMQLPFIQQLMIPILHGLKLENECKYPHLMKKALYAINLWFDSLTIPSIESLLHDHGDPLCRALCVIIQKAKNDSFKKQAIRALGKLGGNNRQFLATPSSMKHEGSTARCISMDFSISKENVPNMIDLSFSNLIDEALDVMVEDPMSMMKTFESEKDDQRRMNQKKKRQSAMQTIRALLTTLIWNEDDYKYSDEESKSMLEAFGKEQEVLNKEDITTTTTIITNNSSCSTDYVVKLQNLNIKESEKEKESTSKSMKKEKASLPPLRVPIPFCEKIHLLKNFDFEGQPTADSKANFDPNPVAPGETVENYKSFGHQKQVKVSEDKIKTAIMSVIIAAAHEEIDDELQTNENRKFRSSLSRHFGLLFATQPIQEFQTEQDKEQMIYIPMQSSKYLTNHLHCDLYLDAVITVLMAQNLQWKHSANCALVEFLDTIDSVCSHLHRHPQFEANNNAMVCDDQQQELFNQEKVLELQTKKLSIIIRHVLKLLEHHVINNTDAVLDGVVLGLTCIAFKIEDKARLLSWELIEQFLMTAVKAARFTFVEDNDARRHEHLQQLMHHFLGAIYQTLDVYYRNNKDHQTTSTSSTTRYRSASDVFKQLGCMVTKMHLVPIGSRELMYKIMDDIREQIGLQFVEFVPIQQLADGLLKNGSDPNDKRGLSGLCGFYETAAWAASTTPPILELNEKMKPFMNIAVRELQLILQSEKQAFLSANPQERMDPMAKAMDVFLEKVEDYSAHIRTQKVMASIKFMSYCLASPFWLNVVPKSPDRNSQYEASTAKWHAITCLVELLISADEALFDAAYDALHRLHPHIASLHPMDLMQKNLIVKHCLNAMDKFPTCADPVKIRVIESFYKLFGSQCIKQKYGTKVVVHFKDWLKHFNLTTHNSYTLILKSCNEAEIPVLMASFFEHIPESKADDDEVAEVDPKTSKPLTCTDRIIDTSISVITEFEMKLLWPYISSYVKNSCNTMNPLHRSIVAFLNKHPIKTIEYMLREIETMVIPQKQKDKNHGNKMHSNSNTNSNSNGNNNNGNVGGTVNGNNNNNGNGTDSGQNGDTPKHETLVIDRRQFYKQQLFLSILSLKESEPIRRQFRDRGTLKNVVDKFQTAPVLVQSYLVRILVQIGEFDKGWLHATSPRNGMESRDFLLEPILKTFRVHIDDIQRQRDLVQFQPDILSLTDRIVKMFIFGFDQYLDAMTIAILCQCFNQLSFANFVYFERFLKETLPQKMSVPQRQKMVHLLLKLVFDSTSNPNSRLNAIPILQYAIRGIIDGDISRKWSVATKDEVTIWNLNDYALSKYLISSTMEHDKLFHFKEAVRAELIGLIGCLMRRCDPNWFKNTTINSSLWKIFKNKALPSSSSSSSSGSGTGTIPQSQSGSGSIGVASRLNACHAILIFAEYFGNTSFLDKIGAVLQPFLQNAQKQCTEYLMLIRSIFTKYIGLQIQSRKKEMKDKGTGEAGDSLNEWLAKFILYLFTFISPSNCDVICKSAIYAFIRHRDALGVYWPHMFLFYRSFFRPIYQSDGWAAMSLSYRMSVLHSIRMLSEWIRKYPESLQPGKQQKLRELYGFAYRFVAHCIQTATKQIYCASSYHLIINEYHNTAILTQYARTVAEELAIVSQESCKALFSLQYNGLQNNMWQIQYQILSQARSVDATNTGYILSSRSICSKTLTVLRIVNAVLKPPPKESVDDDYNDNNNNNNGNNAMDIVTESSNNNNNTNNNGSTGNLDRNAMMKKLCEMFARYDYDKIVEYWTSVTGSIPVQLQVYEQFGHQKKAALHHGKYMRFDPEVEDHSDLSKWNKMALYLDIDAIYYEELTNLILRVSALAQYLCTTKYAKEDNRNGKRLWTALNELQLHHAYDTKIWSQLQKLWKDYKAQLNAQMADEVRGNLQRKHAKLAVVFNSQLFRLWEPMLRSSLIGRNKTVTLLSYLCEFGVIIFEDYKLRIQKLQRLQKMRDLNASSHPSGGTGSGIGRIGANEGTTKMNGYGGIPFGSGSITEAASLWEGHLKVVIIPLIRAIAKIVCINCRDHLKEKKLPKPSDPSSGSSRHHHPYPEVFQKTFYQHFAELFASLFAMESAENHLHSKSKSMHSKSTKKISCSIHLELLQDVGSMVVTHLIKDDFSGETELKMKMIESMRESFTSHNIDLQAIYVDAVSCILDQVQSGRISDRLIPRPIYMVHDISVLNDDNSVFGEDDENDLTSAYFVRSLLTCLCLSNHGHRGKFRNYMRQQIGNTLFERLRLVYGGADWIEIGDKFWVTPGLDLVLDLFDGDANIHLHHPNAKSLQSMKFYEVHGNNNTRLMDMTECQVTELRNVVEFETLMLYRRSTFKAHQLLAPLVEWMYCSPAVVENVWLQVIVPITEKFDAMQHEQLLDSLHSMLLIDTDIGFEAYHLETDHEHQCRDPLRTVMKGVSLNAPRPFPDFGWNIMTRCAYYHCCWFECLDIVNNYLQQILVIPEHTTKFRAKRGIEPIESSEFKLVADLFDDLYTQIGADDVCCSFWKKRCTNPATQCALTLKQFSYWDRVQHQLYRVQTKYFKKARKTSKVAEAECRLWQKDWLLACKKLGHWSILEQRANDQKIASYQLEAQCHAGNWSEFNKLLPFHDEAEDDPDHCHFESYLHQLYHQLSKSIAPDGFLGDDVNHSHSQSQQGGSNHHSHHQGSSGHHQYRPQLHQQKLLGMTVKTRKILDIVSHAMPRNISRGFRKLPEFISSIHCKLLHQTHLFVEIEEGIEGLEMTRKKSSVEMITDHERVKLDELGKKTIARWRQRLPNTYDGLDIWHDVFSWRVNCFEFGSYFQKQPERNSLMFHDKAWTIIQLSKHGRTQNCYNSALLILSKIMSMKRMDARDFYLRIKEQVAIAKMNVNDSGHRGGFGAANGVHHNGHGRGHLNKSDSEQKDGGNPMARKTSSIRRALHILNIASLKWFTELQKSELFSIKAEIKQKLSELDDSNASYSASLAIAGDNWRAWTKWGDFCDSIYIAKYDYRWAMYAMISYLCSLHGGDELTRAYWPDNLMNPIHPNSKSNQNRNAAFQHPHYGRFNQSQTDEVLQKHGDPEKDLQHSNYHHLVIPRILMLIQAARLGPEDNNDSKNKEEAKANGDGNGNGGVGGGGGNNDVPIPPHLNENNEPKTIPTKENSEFVRYLYDGVMKLPPHVFLGYIPQLISGLYRYETDACFLILNDHISFIAPQYLYYYIHHYQQTHEANVLKRTARNWQSYARQHQTNMAKLQKDMQSVHSLEQKKKFQREIDILATRSATFQERYNFTFEIKEVLEKQDSYQKMMKIRSNLLNNKTSYKLQSIINEQRDLIPRLRQFGNDVLQINTAKAMRMMGFLNSLKSILHEILSLNPSVNSTATDNANYLDFGSFVLKQSRYIGTMMRTWARLLDYAKKEEHSNNAKGLNSSSGRSHRALERYCNQFQSDLQWFIDLNPTSSQINAQLARAKLNEMSFEMQFDHKTKLFEKAFQWLKHITFRIGIVERSLSKLKALYGSDLNFYEPSQEILCPGYIGKTLFRRKPRADNLPHSKSAHPHHRHSQSMDPHHLWSMDAPNIIRIAPKLFLLPQTFKEFYILCNDGRVRPYRMSDNPKEGRLRQIREQQLTKFCNELFRSNAETRRRALCCNSIANVVPFDLQTTFYEFDRNEVSFEQIVDAHCIESNSDQIEALHTYSKNLHKEVLSVQKQQRQQQMSPHQQALTNSNLDKFANRSKQGLFETVQKEYFPKTILDDFVAKSLIGSSFKVHSTTAEFFEFKRRFAKSLAFHNLWLLCWRTERRELSSYYLRMDTGELIVRGEFGTTMAIFNNSAHQFPPPNHSFPFRITPNLDHFLSPNLRDSLLTVSLSAMASVMVNPKDDGKDDCLRHFMYIHFRETKLELSRKKILETSRMMSGAGSYNGSHGNHILYQLCDRQLLNQDFKWLKALHQNADFIAQKIKTLSYPVFAEPPFSFKSYDLSASSSKESPSSQQHPSSRGQSHDFSVLDPEDVKYVEPMNRVKAMVDDARSIKVVCEMPPSWNPFF